MTIHPLLCPLVRFSTTFATTPSPRRTRNSVPTNSARRVCMRWHLGFVLPLRSSGYNRWRIHVSRLADLHGRTFDVAIVGGGIIGCGIARDAALRGLDVALFERRDFGSGTTSASTRIVHGGLRYLEMLDFRLVRLDLRERETLLRIAPHLVRPLEFLIPFFEGDSSSPLALRAGLALYDALSYDKKLPSRRWLTAAAARAADSALDRPDVRGAAAYHDARVDSPVRRALENVLAAEEHGARALNYCDVVAATPALKSGPAGATPRVTALHVTATLNDTDATV